MQTTCCSFDFEQTMDTYYKAPWGMTLIVATTLCTLLLAGVAVKAVAMGDLLGWVIGLSLVATLVVLALFIVRGYSVTSDAIFVHRMFWKTRLSLRGLKAAAAMPGAMRRSWRTFGNGGFFSITGFFKNKSLGHYRAFVTDLNRTVVLRYEKDVVVISPDKPEEFVRDLDTRRGGAGTS